MDRAKISEIFVSYQGEGPFVGNRQLFLRFYGCNFGCLFCDTLPESYNIFNVEELLTKVLDLGDNFTEVAITGGEPLLQTRFLESFLPILKKRLKQGIYLETNGLLPYELEKVIKSIDIISMDFKLPSSTGCSESVWELHKKFIRIGSVSELFVKAVITDSTSTEDIEHMGDILSELGDDIKVVLQPVTPVNSSHKEPDGEKLIYFKDVLEDKLRNDVSIFGQMHKLAGIR